MRILAVVSDLMLAVRIDDTARKTGHMVHCVTSQGDLAKELTAEPPTLLIVDLAVPGLDIAALVQAARAASVPSLVAFGAHVNRDALQAAKAAGCTEVLPRSRFLLDLPTVLARHSSPARVEQA